MSDMVSQALFLCIVLLSKPIVPFGNLLLIHALTNATAQTITNTPRFLPKILTVPKFWYQITNSLSRINVPFDFERAF